MHLLSVAEMSVGLEGGWFFGWLLLECNTQLLAWWVVGGGLCCQACVGKSRFFSCPWNGSGALDDWPWNSGSFAITQPDVGGRYVVTDKQILPVDCFNGVLITNLFCVASLVETANDGRSCGLCSGGVVAIERFSQSHNGQCSLAKIAELGFCIRVFT